MRNRARFFLCNDRLPWLTREGKKREREKESIISRRRPRKKSFEEIRDIPFAVVRTRRHGMLAIIIARSFSRIENTVEACCAAGRSPIILRSGLFKGSRYGFNYGFSSVQMDIKTEKNGNGVETRYKYEIKFEAFCGGRRVTLDVTILAKRG